jgi:TolB-like protein/Flp pilus assembly protein TadD
MGQDATSVFVSYSRDDQKRAAPVIAALEGAGFKVWWDGLLEGGANFLPTTEAALESADAVVVLWSKVSVASHWVRDEATRGRDRHCLVPLSLDGTEGPLGFRQFQLINIAKWKGRADAPEMQKVIRAVATLGGQEHFTPLPIAKPPLISRRATMIGGATVVAAGGGIAAWMAGLIGSADANANSVAVLPFENLSGDKAQDYFADGLSAEVRASLSRNTALRVAAQASSDSFRETKDDAPAIAKKLKVAYLLDGSIRVGANTVRIAAELIDGKTGFSRWSKTFEQTMDDVLKIQSEIATSVTGALTNEVGSKGKALSGGTNNVAAFDAYLKGRDLYNNAPDEAGERAALAKFDAAIALDPKFAAAHAARARSLTVIANDYGHIGEIRSLFDEAQKSAERAVTLAPDFADAQSTLGMVLFQDKLDIRAARKPYDISNKLGQGDATVMGRFALYCSAVGRAKEAQDAILRSQDLDPINPLVQRAVGLVHFRARRFAESIPPIQAALAASPKLGYSYIFIGIAQLMLGQLNQAKASFGLESNELQAALGRAIIEKRLGNEQAALNAKGLVESGMGKHELSVYHQAQINAQWGLADASIAALLKAEAIPDPGLIYLKTDPLLDPVRTRPEFSQLLKRLGFD